MTAAKLIRQLQKAIEECGPRVRVTVDLSRMKKLIPNEAEGLSHFELTEFDIEFLPWRGDDDSFYRKDGSERMKTVVALG